VTLEVFDDPGGPELTNPALLHRLQVHDFTLELDAPPAPHDSRVSGKPESFEHTTRILGYPFVLETPESGPEALLRWAYHARASQRGTHVHLVNAYTLALADRDPLLATTLRSGLNLIDGTPLAWLAPKPDSSRTSHHACRGPGLFHGALHAGIAHGVRHYLLGGSPETLTTLQERIELMHPGAAIAGVCSPPFRMLTSDERDAILDGIRTSQADIVWVGLGTPKQDFEVRTIAEALPVTAVAVGAAFDFAAGLKPEAPAWLQGSGLEWTFRLATEPRRLWRRYIFGNARFLRLAVTHFMGPAHHPQ